MRLPKLAWRGTRIATGTAIRTTRRWGTAGTRRAARILVKRAVKLPPVEAIPEGRMVDLPGRGRTFVVDVAGPTTDAPTIVLLHALGCTAYLSWFGVLGDLSRSHRVVALDLRWHGRGIKSSRFRIDDCADDVAALLGELGVDRAVVAGYSLGGAVAQELWHRHPEQVSGLVLASTSRNFRGHLGERMFFPVMTLAMHPLSRVALTKVERLAAALPEMPSVDLVDAAVWGRSEFRSTSAWSMPEVLGELGRFNSAPWVSSVDVPTAVVVTSRDKAIPARRQRRLAAAIPDARAYDAPGGHASIVLDHDRWTPVFLDAVADVTDRVPAPRRMVG
jgi:pimeloyl-ACP methyl ester carboxylesterase